MHQKYLTTIRRSIINTDQDNDSADDEYCVCYNRYIKFVKLGYVDKSHESKMAVIVCQKVAAGMSLVPQQRSVIRIDGVLEVADTGSRVLLSPHHGGGAGKHSRRFSK